MPAFSLDEFASALQAQLPHEFAGEFCVALSGGLDSTVLLHALTQLRATRPWRIRAIHVDHQLQASSAAWARHCVELAKQLDVDMQMECIVVPRHSEQGLESAARTARYEALRQQLRAKEILLTAHHADDQLETMLLALMRGAGARGLAAMPACKSFGPGWHMRPLLAFTRAQLETWAQAHSFPVVDDPSNKNLQFDRNYLRHEVLPLLRKRWPAAAHNATRAAAHLAEANELLEALARTDWTHSSVGDCLRIDALKSLSAERRRNLLRYWLRSRGLRMPSQRKLAALEKDVFGSAADASPCITWEGAEIHWYRGLLYADPARANFVAQPQSWDWREAFQLPSNLGELSLCATPHVGLAVAKLPARLMIKFREGGERILLPGRQHRHDLKKFLQVRGVLPWWRERLPLLYADKELIAVADFAIGDRFRANPGEPAVAVRWKLKPEVLAARMQVE